MTENHRSWALAVEIVLLLLLAATSVGAWFLPDEYVHYVFAILAIGVFYDCLSLLYHCLTLATGRFMSGFPLVGLLFYCWFVVAYRKSLVAPHQTGTGEFLAYKLLDLLLLALVHLLFQMPMLFQGPRERYK